MIYLASPYTHPDPFIQEERYLAAMRKVAEYLKAGVWVYSPIVHCHELAKVVRFGSDFNSWKQYNFHMILLAQEVVVLTLPGWEDSVGVTAEIQFAKDSDIPVNYV